MEELTNFLKERERSNIYRYLIPVQKRKNAKIYIQGKEYIDFSSNDYLGLSYHPYIIQSVEEVLRQRGTSSSASRLLSGDSELHHQLEDKIAEFKHKEAGLVFNSGYQANVGIISALCSRGDVIFADKLSHASIIDGIILSRACFFRFSHNDISHLQYLLAKYRKRFKKALIITESIFSMDGDRACLNHIVELKDKYNCLLLVDEAHSTGIFGDKGEGLVEEQGLSERVELIMGTFSKALGSFGAYVVTDKVFKNYLINTCRSFIYSTALPPVVIMANLSALEVVEREPWRRKELLAHASYFRQSLKEKGFQVKGDSQIVPLILKDNNRAVGWAELLQNKGFWVMPIRYPTVAKNEARLRFSLTYYHNKDILEELLQQLVLLQNIERLNEGVKEP